MRSRGVRLSLLLHPLNRCRIHGPTANPVARGRSHPSKRKPIHGAWVGYVSSYEILFMLQIFNSLTRQKEEFRPIEPGKVRMYVCGPTVYDSCHIGHARSVVIFDVIYRYLISQGYEVVYIRNFTDVDDKIIQRANSLGISTAASIWNRGSRVP